MVTIEGLQYIAIKSNKVECDASTDVNKKTAEGRDRICSSGENVSLRSISIVFTNSFTPNP